MLSKKDLLIIKEKAKEYDVGKVFLFGSNIKKNEKAKDIDIAVEGIKLNSFFKFYGELLFALSKPLDLIDLNKKNYFNSLIRKNGIIIYDSSKK